MYMVYVLWYHYTLFIPPSQDQEQEEEAVSGDAEAADVAATNITDAAAAKSAE